MKIAIANNLYFPFNRGGAETVVKSMISDLENLGHEVFLITIKPEKENTPTNSSLKIYYIPSAYYYLAQIPPILKVIWHFTNIFSFKN